VLELIVGFVLVLYVPWFFLRWLPRMRRRIAGKPGQRERFNQHAVPRMSFLVWVTGALGVVSIILGVVDLSA
jgi:hypothetical protein